MTYLPIGGRDLITKEQPVAKPGGHFVDAAWLSIEDKALPKTRLSRKVKMSWG